jgi:Domain of unknown function (DUF5602)
MKNANTRTFALSAVLVIAAATVAFTVTRAQTSSRNPEVSLFGGTLSSDAKLDAKGNVLEASVTVPMSVIQNAPTTMDMSQPMMRKADAVLEFPAVVRKTTFLNHLGLFWNPMGHEPLVRYGAPHWDFHFFTIEPAQAAAIDCKNLAQGDPKAVAPGWLPPVPPNVPAAQLCLPLMGFHSMPVTEFKAPGALLDGQFEKVMIGGYYQGRFQFIEPMITTALLEKRESFSLPIPVPANIGQATQYPTKFEAIYEEATDDYTFVFSAFKPIK